MSKDKCEICGKNIDSSTRLTTGISGKNDSVDACLECGKRLRHGLKDKRTLDHVAIVEEAKSIVASRK